MYAPCAGNEQAWEFIITRDKENLKRLSDAHPYGAALFGANVAVTICGNRSKLKFPRNTGSRIAALQPRILCSRQRN